MGTDIVMAREDFRTARRQAALQQVLARLTGQPAELLRYDEIRRQLGATQQQDQGLQDIPVDAIVGSVGRFEDYTRSFLPRNNSDEERWARVKAYVEKNGMLPIEVYQLGDVYFVKDGNHRVSVARLAGHKTIPAYVTAVATNVSLQPDDRPIDILRKARYTAFMADTALDKHRPDADLFLTFDDQYEMLKDHIQVHHYFMGLDFQRDVDQEEAAVHWYDTVYLPLLDLIHQQGLSRDFPGRTNADLYIIIARHRAMLEDALGWKLDSDAVISHLSQQSSRPDQVIERLGSKLVDALTPDILENGPPTGFWRLQRAESRRKNRIFAEILVAGCGILADIHMLAHALRVAQRENGRLLGLHVIPHDGQQDKEALARLETGFRQRAEAAGIRAEAAVTVGPVARTIVERAAWCDLVVLSMSRTQGLETETGPGSDFSVILQRSPRPVLAVPEGADSPLNRGLLALDGSHKAQEALYAAAYLAENWGTQLVVTSVGHPAETRLVLAEARAYLKECDIDAVYVPVTGAARDALLPTATDYQCNFLIMGSFGERPLLQIILGSTLTNVLQKTTLPVLVCR